MLPYSRWIITRWPAVWGESEVNRPGESTIGLLSTNLTRVGVHFRFWWGDAGFRGRHIYFFRLWGMSAVVFRSSLLTASTSHFVPWTNTKSHELPLCPYAVELSSYVVGCCRGGGNRRVLLSSWPVSICIIVDYCGLLIAAACTMLRLIQTITWVVGVLYVPS